MVLPALIAGAVPVAGWGCYSCWHAGYQAGVGNGKAPKSTTAGTLGALAGAGGFVYGADKFQPISRALRTVIPEPAQVRGPGDFMMYNGPRIVGACAAGVLAFGVAGICPPIDLFISTCMLRSCSCTGFCKPLVDKACE